MTTIEARNIYPLQCCDCDCIAPPGAQSCATCGNRQFFSILTPEVANALKDHHEAVLLLHQWQQFYKGAYFPTQEYLSLSYAIDDTRYALQLACQKRNAALTD